MQKSVKKGALNPGQLERRLQNLHSPPFPSPRKTRRASLKQARVITMLQSPGGMTIAAMMKERLAAAFSARLPRRVVRKCDQAVRRDSGTLQRQSKVRLA